MGAAKVIDRPLRFCMLTTFYPPYNFGGDGIFVQRLSNELARRGHEVEVIHCRDAYFAAGGRTPNNDYRDHPNVIVHGLKSSFGRLSPLTTQQTGLLHFKGAAMRRVLRKNFDVIHYHNISLLGPSVLAYGQATKLYTMHEYWLICPTHVLFKFNRSACTQRNCLWCTLAYKRPPQWWRYAGLLKRAAKHVDTFIAPSRFSEQKHRQMGFHFPIFHLPHFAPRLAEYREPNSQSSMTEQRRAYFLFVGRLEKLKGLQTLIPIFRSYNRAELWIAGSGSYESDLRELAGNTDRIRFLGRLSENQLQPLYRQAVAVIAPSLCYETFGQVVVEAFSQHTPALVRHLGAMPEIIEESGGGLVYNTDAELIAAMERLVANAALRHEWGARGYQAYLRNWTAEVHLDRYLALVQKSRAAKQVAATHSAG
jgi:glycosyltransferase involved in cell wall biosynthesis